MTSTSTPVSARMRSTSSPPFAARRIALVALARISVGAGGLGEQAESAHGRDGLVGGGRRDDAVAAHDVAEAEHLLLLHERVDVPVGVHVGDEEVEGVRPEVHGRDAHRPPRYGRTRGGSVTGAEPANGPVMAMRGAGVEVEPSQRVGSRDRSSRTVSG